jgi:hypothetical protein
MIISIWVKGQKLWQPHLLHQPNKILGFDNILVFGQRPKVVATSSSSSAKQNFGLSQFFTQGWVM